MRYVVMPFLLMVLFIVGCGGGDSHEKASQDMLALTEGVGDALAGIQQPEDIKPAMEEVDKLTEQLAAVLKRVKDMGKPDAETDKRLKELFGNKIDEEIARWGVEAKRIRDEVVKDDPALAFPIQMAFTKLAVVSVAPLKEEMDRRRAEEEGRGEGQE